MIIAQGTGISSANNEELRDYIVLSVAEDVELSVRVALSVDPIRNPVIEV